MSLQLAYSANYSGEDGLLQLRALQESLSKALEAEDWATVRRLDQRCTQLIDKVIDANKHDGKALYCALNELKDVYASLIVQCKCEVAAIAH